MFYDLINTYFVSPLLIVANTRLILDFDVLSV